jgi:hypothetical protein
MRSLQSILLLAAIAGLSLLLVGSKQCMAAETDKGVEFYLLEDETASFDKVRDVPLSELKLQAAPWIAADNIERYDWSSHYVYLKKPVDIPNQKGARYVNLHGKPFVVTAHGMRCFMGALWSDVSSYLPEGSIAKVDVQGEKLERFRINLFSALRPGETAKEVRDIQVLKEVLKREGLFHAGLECKLDKVEAERKEGDLSLVYTYTIKNNDQDTLYVLDPEKFHLAIFHDFNNGIAIRNVATGDYTRWPNPRTGEPAHAVKPELSWYVPLRAGESLTRSVTMKLTPRVPPQPGKYEFLFTYNGYGHGFPQDELRAGDNNHLLLNKNEVATDPKAADGRIWLGKISAALTLDVK